MRTSIVKNDSLSVKHETSWEVKKADAEKTSSVQGTQKGPESRAQEIVENLGGG